MSRSSASACRIYRIMRSNSTLPSAVLLPPGTPLSLEIGIVNLGITATQSLTVEAAWDGLPGTGLPAGSAAFSAPAPGQLITVTVNIDLSPVNTSVPHQLYATVNPNQNPSEASFDNNTSMLQIGGLPEPTDLKAAAKTGSSLVFLSWTAPAMSGLSVSASINSIQMEHLHR